MAMHLGTASNPAWCHHIFKTYQVPAQGIPGVHRYPLEQQRRHEPWVIYFHAKGGRGTHGAGQSPRIRTLYPIHLTWTAVPDCNRHHFLFLGEYSVFQKAATGKENPVHQMLCGVLGQQVGRMDNEAECNMELTECRKCSAV